MRFQFRFAAILQLHQHQRDKLRLERARLQREQEMIDSEQAAIELQRHAIHSDIRSQENRLISVESLKAVSRKEEILRDRLRTLAGKQASISQQLRECEAALLQAQQNVQRFEKLHASDLGAFQVDQNRRSQQQFDEQAAVAFQRQRAV